MLDKELIKQKFQKSLKTYPDYAYIQKDISCKLVKYLKPKYKNILEIGSYSGFLTREVVKKTDFESYLALDIIQSFDCIKNLSPKIEFVEGDIEEVQLNKKFDLIITSSALQWCNDFKSVVKKLKSYLAPEGQLIIAVFGRKNLYQIREIFNISLNYPEIEEIKPLFSPNAKIFDEIKTLEFSSSIDVLRHLKYTGVNSLGYKIGYFELKEKLKAFDKKYKNKLTYNPLYIID